LLATTNFESMARHSSRESTQWQMRRVMFGEGNSGATNASSGGRASSKLLDEFSISIDDDGARMINVLLPFDIIVLLSTAPYTRIVFV
jgi:hypothetical protein